MRSACLVKEGLHGDGPVWSRRESLWAPLLVQRRNRPLLCSAPRMPTSHSITFVRGAAVEPLLALGSGGCLLDDESSQASDEEFPWKEKNADEWLERTIFWVQRTARSFQMLDSERLSGGVRVADNIGYLPSLRHHILTGFLSGPPGAVINPQML